MDNTDLYNSHEVAERITATAKLRGVKLKDMLLECKISKNTISNLWHGKNTAYTSLAVIADYLDCSVDYLIGRTDNMCSHKIKCLQIDGVKMKPLGTIQNGKKTVYTAANSDDNVDAEYVELDQKKFDEMKAQSENNH